MAAPQQATDGIELVKLVLPVFTFFLGYLLTSLDRYRDERRKRKNLRMILGKELANNYELLNKMVPKNEGFAPPQLLALVSNNMSSKVFDSYLNRLDTLKHSIAETVFEAYSAFEYYKRAGSDLSAFVANQDADQSHFAALATALVTAARSAHEKCAEALQLLPDGPETLSRLEDEQGSALGAYEEISKMLSEKE